MEKRDSFEGSGMSTHISQQEAGASGVIQATAFRIAPAPVLHNQTLTAQTFGFKPHPNMRNRESEYL